jgi:hypothetical protein
MGISIGQNACRTVTERLQASYVARLALESCLFGYEVQPMHVFLFGVIDHTNSKCLCMSKVARLALCHEGGNDLKLGLTVHRCCAHSADQPSPKLRELMVKRQPCEMGTRHC